MRPTNRVKRDCIAKIDRMNFTELMLSDNVQLGLTKNGYGNVSHVQSRAIPLGRSSLGKKTNLLTTNIYISSQPYFYWGFFLDLLIEINSGSGKMVLISIIILEAFVPTVQKPQSLILTESGVSSAKIKSILTNVGSCTPGKFH